MAEQQPPTDGFIKVNAPDGTVLRFPSSMGQQEILAVMRKKYPPVNQQQPQPPAETPPFPQAPPQQQAGGGAPSTASVTPQAQQPLPSAPATRLPTPQTDPAAAAFNMAQVLGEDFKPANAAEAALDVAAKRYAAITRIGKRAPYVDVPQRDATQDRPVIEEQQYSPALIEQKKAAGRWTAEDELRFKQTETRNAADALKQRRIALAKKVEAQGVVTPEDEREMAMIESDRMLIANGYEQSLKEFARDPMVVAKTQEQKAADVEFGRAQKYVEKGDILRPEVLNEYVMRPVANAINSFGMNAVGGALRALDAIGNLPAEATGSERYYSPFAQTADWITEGLDYISAGEGTATKQGIFGEDWSVNSDALLPQFLRTGVYMAGLVASGNAGGTGALGITSFLTTEEDYYREAIDAGLSPSDAQKFSIGAAAATAALEGINPQIYSAGTVKGQMAKRALAALKNGKSTKEAIKDATEFVAKEIGGENAQEFAQAGSDMLAKYVTNEALGEERLDATMTAQQAAETAVLTTALSGLVAGAARAADRPLYQQSIEWAVKNPDEMRRFIAMSVPQAEQEAVVAELERFEKVYNGLPKNLAGPAKREVASAVAEKQRIKEEQSASIVDDVVASITGNKYEEAIKQQDERIAQATGTSLADIIKQQEIVRLQEQYDRAKLKSEVTGNPMPEGMTRPRDVAIAPPNSEVEIAQTDGATATPTPPTKETAIQEGVPPASEGGAGVAEGQVGQPLSAQSLQEAFGYTPEVAQATEAIADAMGLDKSKIKVVKGGEVGEGALLQEQVDGWYSRLDQAVSSKGSTMSASQWKAWMEARAKEGVMSMEEAKWTGLSDFLASKGNEKVTAQQVREFLKDNRVKVEVVEKNDFDVRINEVSDNEIEVISNENDALLGTFDSIEEANEFASQNTKFSQYQLPGGQNYREVLVTLPGGRVSLESGWTTKRVPAGGRTSRDGVFTPVFGYIAIDPSGREYPTTRADTPEGALEDARLQRQAARDANTGAFRSSHFDEPNILVHLRLNDRTDADGRRVLFIEELQSDFGQAHRKLQETIDKNFDDIVEKMKADGVLKKRCP